MRRVKIKGEMKDGVSSLVETDDKNGESWGKGKIKKPSGGFGGTPDDESNDNTGHGQQHKQDANLLPRALLQGGGGTKRSLTETAGETERESPPKDGDVVKVAHRVTHGESDGPFFSFFLGATRPFLSRLIHQNKLGSTKESLCSCWRSHWWWQIYRKVIFTFPYIFTPASDTANVDALFDMFGKVLKIRQSRSERGMSPLFDRFFNLWDRYIININIIL